MEILQNWFCMIPNVVLYDNELSDKQKLLYWVISSLCAEKWYCWASNKFLWELLNVKEWTISNTIKALIDKWYINSNVNKDKGNERHLSLSCEISQEGIVKNHNRYCEKSQHINIIDKYNENNSTEVFFTVSDEQLIKHSNASRKDWKGGLTYSEKDIEKYWQDMILDFDRYYSEPNSKWKQKRQLQKTWSLSWRLATWKKNNEKRYGKKVDYENDLWLFLNKMKTNYEWLKQELGKEKFFELKKKALEYWAENKLL